MPSTPDIILAKGQVLIQQSVSALNVLPTPPLLFGTTVLVYDTSDRIAVSKSVLFDATMAQRIMYGSTWYYLVDEKYISGQEDVLL